MLEWKIEIIGYKDETISEDKWSRHYERLYSVSNKDNKDIAETLAHYLNYDEYGEEEKYICKELLEELLNNPRDYYWVDNPEVTKKLIPYLKDYKDFLIRKVQKYEVE